MGDPPIALANRRHDRRFHIFAAVLAPIVEFALPRPPLGQRMPQCGIAFLRRPVRFQDARILSQRLLAAVAGHPDERLVDVLDLRIQTGDHDTFRALLDGLEQLPQLLLIGLAFGNVHGRRDLKLLPAGRVGDQRGVHQRRKLGTVAPAMPNLLADESAVLPDSHQQFVHASLVLAGMAHRQGLPDQILNPVAMHAGVGVVHIGQKFVHRRDRNAVVGPVGDRTKLAQIQLVPFPFRDIVDDAVPDDSAVGFLHRHRAAFQPDFAFPRMAIAEFAVPALHGAGRLVDAGEQRVQIFRQDPGQRRGEVLRDIVHRKPENIRKSGTGIRHAEHAVDLSPK